MSITWSLFCEVTLKLLRGFGTTCWIFALTLVLALPLGLAISFASMSKFKPLSSVTKIVVWIIRGVPLMLQIFVVFYGPLFMTDWGFLKSDFWRGSGREISVVIAFVINYACYFSEIFRGGIEGIPKGQYEAGEVLGMTKSQIFFKVILMQVIKRILPPMSNEIITLVKDTALARVIVVTEIFQVAETFTARALIWPTFYTAVFYLAFVGILTLLFGYFEKKLSYYKV